MDPKTETIARLLGRCSILGPLEWEERLRIARLARTVHQPHDSAVFFEGDAPDALYVIQRGTVEIQGRGPDGRVLPLATLGAGSVFGEIALLDGAPRTASAWTTTEVELIRVPRDAFLTLVKLRPELALAVIEVLCGRIRLTGDRLAEGLMYSAEARLARHLLRLAELSGIPDDEGIRIDAGLSQAALGEAVGLSRQTVNRLLRGWQEDGLVALGRARVTVCDPEGLSQLAG